VSTLTKDSCAVLRSTPIRAELRAVSLHGLGLPWRLGPCRVLWIPGVIPPQLVPEKLVSSDNAFLSLSVLLEWIFELFVRLPSCRGRRAGY
jgi:hypothetical protein